MPFFGRAAQILMRIALVPLLGEYLGALHPLGDSLAVFRGPLAGLCLAFGLLAFASGRRRPLMLALIVPLIAIFGIVLTRFGPIPALATFTPVVVYQKNLRFDGIDAKAFLADIAATAPDIITLQEVSARNEASVYAALPQDYARHICRFAGVGAVAVAVRHPIVAGSERCRPRRTDRVFAGLKAV